ncbi:5,10-methylene tetrahydromethanopterin reductase, partial [Streptomyces flaveolus]
QLDLLGEEVVPVLREEFAKNRPANVPDAPTHASRVALKETENSQEEVAAG